ncbi:MAG: 3-methyl-2-oxobutanoate hydroxymethyltransferase [Acidimicrobiales bacterium]
MSLSPSGLSIPKISTHKRSNLHQALVMVTAYDAPGAAMADRAGVDIILVGDTLAMVVLGRPDTLSLTLEEMAHHVAAVHQATPRCPVVADMPWITYHLSPADTVVNAAVLVRAGARAVKLEGGRHRLPMIEALINAEIPVMGHLGLTPQSLHTMGGYRVQARGAPEADALVCDAIALAEAGCFALVLEGVPSVVAEVVTRSVRCPTIGIGAGPHCDGQVLVLHDVLGLGLPGGVGDRSAPAAAESGASTTSFAGQSPRFIRRYAELSRLGSEALVAWAADVRSGEFPSSAESYGSPELAEWSGNQRRSPGSAPTAAS